MKYVLDASAAAFWVLRNPLRPQALRLRDGYQRGLHELIAPAHFPLEIANGLTKAKRQKLIPAGRCPPPRLWRDYLNAGKRRLDFPVCRECG